MTRSNELSAWVAACAIAGLGACGGDNGGRGTAGGGGVASIGDDGGTAADTGGGSGGGGGDGGSGSGSADSADGGGGPLFDIGSAEEGGMPPMNDGCQKVDFLFIVDNSVSMEGEQSTLVAAFPMFMDTIQSTLAADSDYHILVTDTDEWGRCNTINGFVGMDPGSNTCDNYIKTTPFVECDEVRGAGVINPAGKFASDKVCSPMGGERYIIMPGEPDLPGTFECMATVGTAGHPSERPMDSMIAALQPELNAMGACNEGFLRDDALLVITFMSDDPHYEDTDGPDQWYDAVVTAKNGDPSSVVVLGLTPDWDGCQDGKGPPKGAHWAEFIAKWGDNGLHGNVCGTSDEYVSFFQEAVSTIDTACDQFNPPG